VVQRAKETLLSVYYTYSPIYAENWQSINLHNLTAVKVPSGPADYSSRAYTDSPNGKRAAFIEERDGKSELYLTDHEGENEQKITSLGAVNQFVNWIDNDYVIFSLTKSGENALYVVAVETGKVTKIADFYRANARTYGGGYNPTY
jgi:Tol biopolymer transport system component